MFGNRIHLFAALAAVMIASVSCGGNEDTSENVVDEVVTEEVAAEHPLGFCPDSLSVTEGKVKNGQFFSSLLGSLGMSAQEAFSDLWECLLRKPIT